MADVNAISRWWKLLTGAATTTTNKTNARADIGAVADDDARLSDARTPTSHAASHATGGSDEISPADIGAGPANQVETYLVDDGIHTITSASGVATPDAANGRSQKFPLTENVADFNPPTNLADGQSMLVQVLQDSTPRTLTLDPAWTVMGAGTASDIGSLTAGQYAWLSITRYGTDYLISITKQA